MSPPNLAPAYLHSWDHLAQVIWMIPQHILTFWYKPRRNLPREIHSLLFSHVYLPILVTCLKIYLGGIYVLLRKDPVLYKGDWALTCYVVALQSARLVPRQHQVSWNADRLYYTYSKVYENIYCSRCETLWWEQDGLVWKQCEQGTERNG